MAILSITTDTAGQINVNPRIVKIVTNDSYDDILTVGYLNTVNTDGFLFFPSDMLLINYNNNTNFPMQINGLFSIIIANGVYTIQPFVGSSLSFADVFCSPLQLSGAKKAVAIPSYLKQTFIIRDIFINLDVNFAGGNRNLTLTDGTLVYSVIPAATLQSLVNGRWGDAAIPFPVGQPLYRQSTFGKDIYFQYSGGTTDYTSGAVFFNILYQFMF